MLQSRLIEEKMLILLRQGKISKWFSGIGQEAISVGATLALDPDEMIFPMHRNLGVFTTRGIPLYRLFAQWQGKASGFTKGRDRSFHFGAPDYNVVGMISHLGPQLALASGVALAHKLRNQPKIAVAFTGEGGTSEGDFHEALNTAAVWKLPVIFIIENNGYGLSTPASQQYACTHLADRGAGYGMASMTIDGNNVLEVYQTISDVAQKIKADPQPYLIECQTFRMRGHEEASGTKYVPKDLMEAWATKDPISNYTDYLLDLGVVDRDWIDRTSAQIKEHINDGLDVAFAEQPITADLHTEMSDVYALSSDYSLTPSTTETAPRRFIDAISDALSDVMCMDDDTILMGQDIADYGGVFKITEGFMERFGADRVRNTPLCESAIVGIALGLTLRDFRAMVEMQFADFVTCGFNQIVNNLAKLHYRWGHSPNVVVRMPCGGGVGAGPFHSQTNEAWFTHTPGLKVVYPSTPYDAKGLLTAAMLDPSPVLFFEHKKLYRTLTEDIPTEPYTIPIGQARIARAGQEATIVTYGQGVHWALQTVADMDVDVEIIDLRSLAPLDFDTIAASISKTHRVLILHEDVLTGGIGGHIAAHIAEHHFEELDAPVVRVTSLDTPVPFAADLEDQYLASQRLADRLAYLLDY